MFVANLVSSSGVRLRRDEELAASALLSLRFGEGATDELAESFGTEEVCEEDRSGLTGGLLPGVGGPPAGAFCGIGVLDLTDALAGVCGTPLPLAGVIGIPGALPISPASFGITGVPKGFGPVDLPLGRFKARRACASDTETLLPGGVPLLALVLGVKTAPADRLDGGA